jgi:hypothetical protein
MKSDTWKRGELARLKAMHEIKPTAATSSPWEDSSFCSRVVARAERYEKLLAQLRDPQPKAYCSAKDAWAELVEKIQQDQKVDRSKAVRIAAKQRPDILEAMKIEANRQPVRR